jgi:type IV secretion system protein VirD4
VVFAAVLHDLIAQGFERYNGRGSSIDPRLLVVLDEAANTPLPKLPQWAATITGAGIQLVTVWQSKAQLDQAYGKGADNVLTNHRTMLIFPSGLSDLSTIEYISALVGDEHVRSELDERTGTSAEVRAPDRSPSTAEPYLSPSTLRRVQVGDALVVHGALPPAWIRAGKGVGRHAPRLPRQVASRRGRSKKGRPESGSCMAGEAPLRGSRS